MKRKSKTAVFFGSGPVAAKSLQLLVEHCEIEAVITKPRPAHHRGSVPVIDLARQKGLPIYTATNKRTLDALIASKPFQSTIGVLIDFGIIISQEVIDYFPEGIVNSHFSLLPEWRGADPITFAILSGQKRTGVSLMLLVAGMDEGPLLAQSDCAIDDDMTTPELTSLLVDLSDAALKEILPLYRKGRIEAADQLSVTMSATKEPTYSRKLTKEDGQLDWNKPAAVLEREIRAFAEWPKSHAKFGSIDVIITLAEPVNLSGAPGETTTLAKQPVVYCGENALILKKLKPAGKREMTGMAFLAGYSKLFLGQ